MAHLQELGADDGRPRARPTSGPVPAGRHARHDDLVIVDPTFMTSHPSIFAGGDMIPADRTITDAIGHGKQAAHHIDTSTNPPCCSKPAAACPAATASNATTATVYAPDNAVIKLGPGNRYYID